jgi:hypothetical protein
LTYTVNGSQRREIEKIIQIFTITINGSTGNEADPENQASS